MGLNAGGPSPRVCSSGLGGGQVPGRDTQESLRVRFHSEAGSRQRRLGQPPSVTFYLRPPGPGQPPPDSLADKEQQSQGSSVSPGPAREGGSGLCLPHGSPVPALRGGWQWAGLGLGRKSTGPGVRKSWATWVSSEEGTWGKPAAFPEGWLARSHSREGVNKGPCTHLGSPTPAPTPAGRAWPPVGGWCRWCRRPQVLGAHAGSVDSGGSSLPWATRCGLDAWGPFTDGTPGPWVSAEDRTVSPKSPQ